MQNALHSPLRLPSCQKMVCPAADAVAALIAEHVSVPKPASWMWDQWLSRKSARFLVPYLGSWRCPALWNE